MNFLKLVFEKIGSGLLYGVGFCTMAALFIWGANNYFEKKNDEIIYGNVNEGECRNFKKCEEASGLAVQITTERISEEEFILLGNVKNTGNIKWTSAKIKTELYDNNKKFIDECTKYIDQKIFPNTSINFKLSCTKCNKLNLENYSYYSISIIDADTY